MVKKQPKLAETDVIEIERALERGLREARKHAQKKGVKGYQQYKNLLEAELSSIDHKLRIPTYEGK